ncbi:MAG: DinB family protein [Actinomycetota bacterium]
MPKISVYVEVGARRVFASALDWPGWSRGAKTESQALEALIEYAPRYAKAVPRSGFTLPVVESELRVVARIPGDGTTDFGVPAVPAPSDPEPLKDAELRRLIALWKKCWTTFDNTAERNKSRTLRTGPRGGGRSVAKMIEHVVGADEMYLGRLAGSYDASKAQDRTRALRAALIEAATARAHNEPLPENRRSKKVPWPPRYAIRRSAWHALDHAWEIEDRAR